MADRLSALDVSFLYMEEPTTPMHVGGLLVFEPPPEGFDYDRLVQLVSTRIAFVPKPAVISRSPRRTGAANVWTAQPKRLGSVRTTGSWTRSSYVISHGQVSHAPVVASA